MIGDGTKYKNKYIFNHASFKPGLLQVKLKA